MNYFIGLLSGTSVDGIDAALVSIKNDKIKLVCSHEQTFSESLKIDLQSIIQSQLVSLLQLSDADTKLANEFSTAVEQLISKSKIDRSQIVAIGSHGQTIFHQPKGKNQNTWQIGSPHIIAANTGIKVVSNFRNLDMAYGGQGAPLAPLIHKKLFEQNNINTAVVNLGGIANISFIGKDYQKPIGFDTGPANCLLDEWVFKHQGKNFDKDGQWASQGQLNQALLNTMLNDDYFSMPHPKSTGREYFNQSWLKSIIEKFESIPVIDIHTTLTHLTAATIANAVKREQHSIEEMILMGGGAYNKFLKNLIQHYSELIVTTADEHDYDSDWIEAILFAYLAYIRIKNQRLDLSTVTGSTQKLFVGDIIIP